MQEAITPVIAVLRTQLPPPPPPMPTPPEPWYPPPPKKVPMLICGDNGVKTVIPKEATRDVLAGKVAYMLIDQNGITKFGKKHNITALKLTHKGTVRIEDYPCLGGYERKLAPMPKKREGMGYRRKYISPELIGRGIYGSDGPSGSAPRSDARAMSSSSLYRGYGGPRA